MKNKFEIGKAYQHTSGMQMFICGMADTIYHGTCFIAENGWHTQKLKERLKEIEKDSKNGGKIPFNINGQDLKPVSMKDEAMQYWTEIPKEEFIKHNTEYEIKFTKTHGLKFKDSIVKKSYNEK